MNNNKQLKDSQATPYCFGYKFMHRPTTPCIKCGLAENCKECYLDNLKKGKIIKKDIEDK